MTTQLIFLGLEKSGVHLQANILAKQIGIPHISMLQLFSRSMRDRFSTELQSIQQFDRLSSPNIEVLAMLEVRLRQPDARQGWILTDFPTNLAQAHSLHLLLEYMGYPQPQAVYFNFSPQILLERSSLELIYSPDSVEQRLERNQRQMWPIVEYYQELGCLKTVEGDLAAQIVNEKILEALQIAMFV
ncbi:MAG: nucleoside monophosphate kinase [Leptolyngbya sp. Prado105]|jgi:adenylate kinase|nr:nucleoside monophosphate kinase [Leptolyngbya sp. Prado105]